MFGGDAKSYYVTFARVGSDVSSSPQALGRDSTPQDATFQWLFISTGTEGEYWIVNKGAEGGLGQALTAEKDALKESFYFVQKSFVGDDSQKFTVHEEGPEHDKSIEITPIIDFYPFKVVERLGERSWGDKVSNFTHAKADAVKCDDMLVSYLFWNTDNENVHKKLLDSCESPSDESGLATVPPVQSISIKNITFLNRDKKRAIYPAFHRVGCATAPWRGGLGQCNAHEIPAGGKFTFEDVAHLENNDAIVAVITDVALLVVSAALTAGTLGAGAPVGIGLTTAGALLSTGLLVNDAIVESDSRELTLVQSAELGKIGLSGVNIPQGASAVAGMAIFAWDGVHILNDAVDIALSTADGTPISPESVWNSFGLSSEYAPEVKNELGKYVVVLKDEAYEKFMDKWYVEETKTGMAYNSMYFSEGTALFVNVPDIPIVGEEYYIKTKGSNKCLSSRGDSPVFESICNDEPEFRFTVEFSDDKRRDYSFLTHDNRKLATTGKFESAGDGYVKINNGDERYSVILGDNSLGMQLVNDPLVELAQDKFNFRFEPAASWNEAGAHDKGCTDGGAHRYHVRCERGDGSAATYCDDLPQGNFKGQSMTSSPVRLSDRAWTEVDITDNSCSLSWNEAGAHDKGCTDDGSLKYHVRCESGDGAASTKCDDLPQGNFKGQSMTSSPVRLSDRAWTEVNVSDNSCSLSWNEAGAHDKGCFDNARRYHVRCEQNGGASTKCDDLSQGNFKGQSMTSSPVRLSDRAWTEVNVSDNSCSLSWNEAGAHDKGCSGNSRTYHVRCERNGSWSVGCTNLPFGSFKGKPMLSTPVRLSDRAWTEVKVACR